jgi:macrolide-specific efflux system membrane fusion protein
VQTGQSSAGQTEIASGLQEGDQVIITTTIPTFNGGTGRQLPGGGGFPGGGQFPGGGA